MSTGDKQRWVVNNVDQMTVEVVKALAASSRFSMGYVIDLAVEYFSRKVKLDKDAPMHWELPDDF